MCNHDATYQTENESNGGAGCPRCNQKRVVMVQHASGEMEVEPGWYVNPAVTLMQPDTIALLEQTRLIFEQSEPIEY